jgi:hypothetical protein
MATSIYGQYDNGASVFNFYDNFVGTVLSSVWVVPQGSNYKVNNGFIGMPSDGATYAVYNPSIQETSSIIAEWGLNMSSTTYPNQFSYFQLNRYTSNSNEHWLGVINQDQLSTPNFHLNVNISSNGFQIFGIWNNNTTVTWYFSNYQSYTRTSSTSVTDYLSLGWAYNGQPYNFPTIYWVRTRAYPPNDVMPVVNRYYCCLRNLL